MKKKKRYQNFEEKININAMNIKNLGEKIITDAGWEKLSFDQAIKFFDLGDLQDWYSSRCLGEDDSELLAELGVDISPNHEENLENFFDNYDWTPKIVDVIVAKAVYQNHAWVRLLSLAMGSVSDEKYYFQHWESEAILLGIHLRKYLGLDIPVINDCQNAVRNQFFRYPNIYWLPRTSVKKAHNLKITQATKIYTEAMWESEWLEEYWD